MQVEGEPHVIVVVKALVYLRLENCEATSQGRLPTATSQLKITCDLQRKLEELPHFRTQSSNRSGRVQFGTGQRANERQKTEQQPLVTSLVTDQNRATLTAS